LWLVIFLSLSFNSYQEQFFAPLGDEIFLLRTPEELIHENPFDSWKGYLAPEEDDPFDNWKDYLAPEELDQGNPFASWKSDLAPEELDQGNSFNPTNKNPPILIVV